MNVYGPSVCHAVHTSVMAGWIFFIWYNDQEPAGIDACKLEYGSVPNLNSYSNFVIQFVCLFRYLREECVCVVVTLCFC